MSTTAQPVATEADLLAMPRDGRKYELVDGAIRVSPAGFRHGRVCVKLSTRLEAFAEARGAGYVLDSSTGFRLPGGNVRLPDVAFVVRDRLPGDMPEGFSPVPPDLAVEVLSPADNPRHILDKVGEYLSAGVRLVWVIDPIARRATVLRSLTDVRIVAEEEMLDGEHVLPGFRCRLGDLL
jgi:Uma2 family endonuclease